MDTIRYLAEEGYVLRCRLYGEASSPEALMEESDDEEECASVCRGWRFAQWYKLRFGPEFLVGWDVGRAAMLARWGCFLGWITEGEALGILWELSQKAAEELHSWREFAESYLLWRGCPWPAPRKIGFQPRGGNWSRQQTAGYWGFIPVFVKGSLFPWMGLEI